MKIVQLIKQVNNTELGKGGTHETYILIPQDLDVSDLFEKANAEYKFKDRTSAKEYAIRLTASRETRIVGMGSYYRDSNAIAGDRIILEKRSYENGESDYYISLHSADDTVYFQKVKNHFEVLTPEKASQFLGKELIDSAGAVVKVEFHGEVQKRSDSPAMTKVYDIIVGDRNIQSNYKDRDVIGLQLEDGQIKIKDAQPWKKYIVEVKE